MSSKKFRWSQVYESSEEELITLLQARNIHSERVQIDAGDHPTKQHTKGATTIWCAEGSLTIASNATTISLQPGDALSLEINSTYLVQPGITGCAYYLTM